MKHLFLIVDSDSVSSLYYINVFKTLNETYDQFCLYLWGFDDSFDMPFGSYANHCHGLYTVSIITIIFCTDLDLFVHWKM